MYNTLKALIILLSFILFTACREKKYHIGVSQCIHNDWNRQLIKDLQREDNSYPEVELDISHNVTNVSEQIADVRRLIKAKVDLIMILPEAAEALSPVVDEAAAAGIPVILIDSETASTNYTARVSVDNRDIGIRGGQFASYSLNGHGKVIEVLGVKESSSTLERRRGFHDVISNYPDIQVIDSCETNWTYESAFPLLDSLIALHPDVDLIAAYNDPLAIAAYDACQKHNLNKKPIIMGIDALAGEGQGIQCVLDGKIDATCTNPTCALESFQLALDILEGRPYERVTRLPTQLIDRDNVQMVLRQEQHIEKMNQRIEAVNGRLGKYLERSNILQLLILAAIFLIALIIGFVIYAIWAMQQRAKLRKRIEDATQAKLTFFSNVSHSCRTPLTLIAGPIQTILEEGGLTERQKELIALMGIIILVMRRRRLF
jgi:ABC-type sugar transport system substrate-binding protein